MVWTRLHTPGRARLCGGRGRGSLRGRRGPRRARSGIAAGVLVGLAFAASAGAPAAFGAFSRPFMEQIAGVPVGAEELRVPPFELEVPFGGTGGNDAGPEGVAVSAGGDLWVGNGLPGRSPDELDEFGPEGHFLRSIELKPGNVRPASIAVSDSTGDIYIAGASESGAQYRVEVLEPNGKAVAGASFPVFNAPIQVAVDNASGPTEGEVYVASIGEPAESLWGAIEKFSASGEPRDFAELGSPEIAGGEFTGIVVDGEGDVYALNVNPEDRDPNPPEAVQIEEFRPGGARENVIDAADAGGWEPYGIEAVGFDPVSGHVLVGLSRPFTNAGMVDEFNSADELVGRVTRVPDSSTLATSCGVARAGPLHSATALAGSAAGSIYVVDELSAARESNPGTCEHAVDVYGPGRFLPTVALSEPSERRPATAVVNGTVNPEKQVLVECAFEYVTESAYDENLEKHGGEGFADLGSGGKRACVPQAAAIAGDAPVQVHADLPALSAGVTYRYRLVATSSGELGGTGETQSAAFTTPARPAIVSSSASAVSSRDVDLRGQVDPLGAPTGYYFEYADAAQYDPGAEDPYAAGARAPVVPGEIGAGGPTGSADASVLEEVGGLTPGTVYHWRLVASNEIGVTEGPDHTFTTLQAPAAGLPEGRVYELVTPPDKGAGADLFGSPEKYYNSDGGVPSVSGDEFLMVRALAAFGPSPASEGNSYVFKREAGGWRTIALDEPALGVQSVQSNAIEPTEFATVGLLDYVGSYSSAGGAAERSLVGPPGGPYATLHTDAAIHEEPEEHEETKIVGASRGLDRVILESMSHGLAPGAETQDPGAHELYEWDGGGECAAGRAGCTLVNVRSNGKAVDRCGAVLGQGHVEGAREHAISADGARVVFTAPDPYAADLGEGCWNDSPTSSAPQPFDAPQVYLRAGGDTTELSVPEAGVTEAGEAPTLYPAVYVGASEDDSKVFFVTKTELTAQAAALHLHDNELYECEISEGPKGPVCKLTRVSAGQSGAAGEVLTVPAISENGAAVYFTAASGELAPGAPAPGGEAEADLYRYDTQTGVTAFVATVDRYDYPREGGSLWMAAFFGESSLADGADWYTTPDGNYLLFATARELTGYSTAAGPGAYCPLAAFGGSSGLPGHCAEVYRYDAADGSIVCVSCNPSGAAPVSNAQFAGRSASQLPAGSPDYPLSNDGADAFFDTADALVSQDSNGTLDVYEWHEQQEDGASRVSLISSGQSLAPSYFLGASPDGANVFFGTHSQLVPEDTDSSGDVYDARIGGGFPPASARELECEGAACQNVPAQPSFTTPGSATFAGPGNPGGRESNQPPPSGSKPKTGPKPKCKQGYVRKKVKKQERCVRAKAKRSAHRASHERRPK